MKRHTIIGDDLCRPRQVAGGRAADRPAPSRAARWTRLSGRSRRRANSAGGADRDRGGRVRRLDDRSAVPPAPLLSNLPGESCGRKRRERRGTRPTSSSGSSICIAEGCIDAPVPARPGRRRERGPASFAIIPPARRALTSVPGDPEKALPSTQTAQTFPYGSGLKNGYRPASYGEGPIKRVATAAFLAALTCSGAAGLIYEVSWTRLLTLHIEHTTAAASAVVSAFMGGLALGAALAGRFAARLSLRQCLYAYVLLEASVAAIALVLPAEIRRLHRCWPGHTRTANLRSSFRSCGWPPRSCSSWRRRLRWAPRFRSRCDGSPREAGGRRRAQGASFTRGTLRARRRAPCWRVSCYSGAWRFRDGRPRHRRERGRCACGSAHRESRKQSSARRTVADTRKRGGRSKKRAGPVAEPLPLWLAAIALGFSGFASLLFEITWTRVLAMTIGPTTYAFAATIAALILGLAIGSAVGAALAARTRAPAAWLAATLAMAGAGVTVPPPLRAPLYLALSPSGSQRLPNSSPV